MCLFLLYWLAYRWGLFPLGCYGTPAHVILPAFALGIAGGGWYARVMRSAMLDVINQDYVRTARAKGLSEPRVILRHAVRNALLPVVSMVGLDIGTLIRGVAVVVSVFSWPRIRRL